MAMGFIRGLPNLGGPIVTASGLVFIAASRDDKLRAFDVSTGKELWQASLPAGGQATPMSYVAAGRQFVVVAAGGHSRLGSMLGDAVIAFSLPPGTGTGSTIR
jgi:quinoprotein glucose dehydrogenase